MLTNRRLHHSNGHGQIDSTILSQCGTLLAMRLSNPDDRAQVRSATSDGLKGFLELIPTLRTGEAIILGEAVSLPTRVLVTLPDEKNRPDSHDPKLFDPTGKHGWNAKPPEKRDFKSLVKTWRDRGRTK